MYTFISEQWRQLYAQSVGSFHTSLYVAITEDGQYLTHQRLCSILHSLLMALQMDTQRYNAHSFCVGVVTTATQANIPDPLIQLMGDGKGSSYLTYIKTSPVDLAKFSKGLITNDCDPDTTVPTQVQP